MTGPEIIRQYILAMKGVDIVGINEPVTPIEQAMYQRALSVAMWWWMDKGNSSQKGDGSATSG